MPIYPTDQEIGQINKELLETVTVKSTDRHGVLQVTAIKNSIDLMRNDPGDLYDKAASLFISLVRSHAFESGNRRTALVASLAFLQANAEKPKVLEDEDMFRGIRAGFYSKSEIRAWLMGNAVRKFSR
jgi:death-on-curing family protein